MKYKLWTIGLVLAMLLNSCGQPDTKTYLKKVIENIKSINSVEYHGRLKAWNPYDENPVYDIVYVHHEYDNPADTVVGVSYAWFVPSEGMRFEGGYDGKIRMIVYDEHKGLLVDDFSSNRFPYRPVNPPFFNMTKNILQYAIETTDSIVTDLVDEDSCYHFSMTIHENEQVHFFGKPIHIPNTRPEGMEFDPTSYYEVWIRKSDNLPYKYKRTLNESKFSEECINPIFNKRTLADFNLFDYIPQDYEVRDYNSPQKKKNNKYILQDKPAPEWTLTDIEDRPVSLSDIKSKVILLNFTGIGCGACQLAIPFLKELKGKYDSKDFELIAIESWSGRTSARKGYSEKKELNYLFLGATEEVLKNYQTGRAAPWFFLLDESHIIRKIFYGYSEARTGKKIEEAITNLLKQP